jgi:hypothetical protein
MMSASESASGARHSNKIEPFRREELQTSLSAALGRANCPRMSEKWFQNVRKDSKIWSGRRKPFEAAVPEK